MLGELSTDSAVDSVGSDDQIGFDVRNGVDLAAESKLNAQVARSRLKNVEQLLARDATETMSAGCDTSPVNENIDVIPMREVLRYRAIRRLIVTAKILERLIRKNNTPTECLVRAV